MITSSSKKIVEDKTSLSLLELLCPIDFVVVVEVERDRQVHSEITMGQNFQIQKWRNGRIN